MKSPRNSRRTAVALTLSTTFHVVILTLILSQAAPDYELPESSAPPMDVKIIPEPPPPPVIIERPPPLKPAPTKAPPPTPKARPRPPQPEVSQPTASPAPPLPAPTLPKPAPPPPTPTPAPPQPPVVKLLPAAVPRPTAASAPSTPPAPVHLNIHKPEKEAPGNVATLPFAPAPSAPTGARAPPPPATASGEPALGGSRLNGLSPYPYGVMPNGGGGLRGTLIGCANAEAVSLSAAERARCNERFGTEAARAPAIDSMSPTKRAAFDKTAERQDRSLRYLDSGLPPGSTRGAHGFGGMSDDQPLLIPLPR